MAQQDIEVLPNVLESFGNIEKMTRGHLVAFLESGDDIRPNFEYIFNPETLFVFALSASLFTKPQ